MNDEEMYRKISDTLTILHTEREGVSAGEEDILGREGIRGEKEARSRKGEA